MELQYLKYFSSVADTLSFSEAAKRCRVSQPSLSAQIRILEERLGTQLFHRSKRSVSLTKEGEALLPRVKKILIELDGLSTAAKELQNPLAGTLFIGATPLIPHSGIFDKLSALTKKNEALRLSFTEGGGSELVEKLLAGQLDIVFLPFRERLGSPQIQYCVSDIMEVAICSPRGADDNLPFINIKAGCGLGEFMGESARLLGKEPTHTLQANHISMIKSWIQLGTGWSILPTKLLTKADEKFIDVRKHRLLKPIRLCGAMLRGQRADAILSSF